ncbi:GTPase IMAP family member 7-like [Epinephelus moara]|uniref:GTPase IMAP family member 7-like n=1 Tax=Epinephelus moara TaxID=300413 RepID=UPI00214EFAF5|nr:GTPase IMAP family member 7-like [Epinephelus moara]
MADRRIAILGKTGAGKSSLANTIFGEELFKTSHNLNSETRKCQAETRSVNGRNITLIDTPGFFDTDGDDDKLKPEIVRCITECAPGPHAFLIVLTWGRYTKQEQDVIIKINEYFSEEVFKYTTVLFTHGDQLPAGETIENLVHQNESVSDLVKKCGGRCHVIDNKYWKNNQRDEYRSNKYQVEELLKSVDKTTEANKGGYYTNELFRVVQEIIEQKKMRMRKSSGNMSEEEITQQAKDRAFRKIWIKLAGVATGALLGALFGAVVMGGVVVSALKELVPVAKTVVLAAKGAAAGAAGAGGTAAGAAGAGAAAAGGTAAGAAAGGGAAAAGAAAAGGAAAAEAAAAAGAAAGGGAAAAAGATAEGAAVAGGVGATGTAFISLTSVSAAVGAVVGGYTGYHAAEGADTPWEAVKMSAAAVKEGAQSIIDGVSDCLNVSSKPPDSKLKES